MRRFPYSRAARRSERLASRCLQDSDAPGPIAAPAECWQTTIPRPTIAVPASRSHAELCRDNVGIGLSVWQQLRGRFFHTHPEGTGLHLPAREGLLAVSYQNIVQVMVGGYDWEAPARRRKLDLVDVGTGFDRDAHKSLEIAFLESSMVCDLHVIEFKVAID